MTRATPIRFAIAVIAGAAILSSCGVANNRDVAARVGDVELSEADLADLAGEAMQDPGAKRVPIAATNDVIWTFVVNEVLRSDLDALGEPVPTPNTEELTLDSLLAEADAAFTAWQAVPPSPAQVEALYNSGPTESGITCTAHILVDAEDEANDIVAELEAGGDWSELAEQHSIDPGSGANGGVLPCDSTEAFSASYIPEYVEAALDADIGVPVGPVESQFGYHIIVVREFEDLTQDELGADLIAPRIRLAFAASSLDIYIDPRYGTFDPASGVVPLG